jgi:hypothetical protein
MECTSIKDVEHLTNNLQPGDWFIVDVDDTLIAPQATMFRPESPSCGFIDYLKNLPHENLTEILSTWRLKRKAMLVEQEWPEILNSLIKQGVTVLALTQVNSDRTFQITIKF